MNQPIPPWFIENLEFKNRNQALLDKGNELQQQALNLNCEVAAFVELTRIETQITDLAEISKLPQAKLYIEKMNEATFLKLQSSAFFSRWLECERVRLDCLRCVMQTHNIQAIPDEWEVCSKEAS
jgi:hypothetical protein